MRTPWAAHDPLHWSRAHPGGQHLSAASHTIAKTTDSGQVNNVYIFPGLSYGAVACQASTIPDRFFMVAAEAVANSLTCVAQYSYISHIRAAPMLFSIRTA